MITPKSPAKNDITVQLHANSSDIMCRGNVHFHPEGYMVKVYDGKRLA